VNGLGTGAAVTPPATVRETHAAVVVLFGDRAYKVKKPLDLGFLDFRSRSVREQVCHREVELNRRLAPDVYLGVADVSEPDGAVCEHVVVMRRMPEERRLSTLVGRGVDVRGDLRQLARLLAAFHAQAGAGGGIAEQGRVEAVRARWESNLAAVRALEDGPVDAGAVDRVARLALRFLAGRGPLFTARVTEGRIRDGHGDLLAEDVFCLADGPRALDCLEFDDRLRWMDVLDDAACLTMDLERLGAADVGTAFLDWYKEFSGHPQPVALRHHYVAYRAFMRAKVACLRAGQGVPEMAGQARLLTEIALRHLNAGRIQLILVGGAPGTGKSTVAGALADRLGAVLLRSDRVRKEVAGVPPDVHLPAGLREGIYNPASTEQTYAALVDRASGSLEMGESVVLDASFANARYRRMAEDLAGRVFADHTAFRCDAPEAVVRERLQVRISRPDRWSDAGERPRAGRLVPTIRRSNRTDGSHSKAALGIGGAQPHVPPRSLATARAFISSLLRRASASTTALVRSWMGEPERARGWVSNSARSSPQCSDIDPPS
jgi:uncharacterized protein